MNYCQKCGNKLSKNTKFCSKCGSKIQSIQTNKKVNNKEEKKEKLLLSIGTLLIIVASIIFAVANWNEMTSIFKVLFLSIESLLFLSLSIFSKKLDYKMPYKFLWLLGISFIPIILHIVALDKMLGTYFSYRGNGIYVYLSISTFICTILYFISHRFLKSNFFLLISYVFLYLMIYSIFGIFKLQGFKTILPIFNSINLIICIFYSFIKSDNYNKVTNVFMSIILIIFSIFTCIYTKSNSNYILQAITYITIIASLLILIFKKNKNILIYTYPFIINLIIVFSVSSVFGNYVNIILFMTLIITILINFIINIKDNNILKNISYILMLIFSLFILINYNVSYLTLLICSIILLIVSLFIIKLDDQKVQVNLSKILLPILTFIIIYTLIINFIKIDLSIILLITSLICFTLFVIFHQKKKDLFIKTSYEVFAYIYLIISGLVILINTPDIISFILNEVLWIYYFTFNKIIKRNKALNTWLLILLIINFIILSIVYSISFMYSLIFVSLITLLLDYIEIKIYKKIPIYIYFSLISTALAVIYNIDGLAIAGVGLLVIAYAFTYYVYNKLHKQAFAIKFFYTLIGFILINSIFNYFIDNLILANLLILISYLVIIISMFLLQTDTDNKVLCYSFVILAPYLELVNRVDFLNKYSASFIVALYVILVLIYFEKVFTLKEKDKIIFELILLGLVHLFTLFNVIMLDFVLAAIYIFYGFYKKREAFTIFGTVLLLCTLIINIFKIADNITTTCVLLAIGVVMLGYVFYMEAKKRKKK